MKEAVKEIAVFKEEGATMAAEREIFLMTAVGAGIHGCANEGSPQLIILFIE